MIHDVGRNLARVQGFNEKHEYAKLVDSTPIAQLGIELLLEVQLYDAEAGVDKPGNVQWRYDEIRKLRRVLEKATYGLSPDGTVAERKI